MMTDMASIKCTKDTNVIEVNAQIAMFFLMLFSPFCGLLFELTVYYDSIYNIIFRIQNISNNKNQQE
jgi:hypothetical protein